MINGNHMEVDGDKRNFLKMAAFTPFLPLGYKLQQEMAKMEFTTPVNVIIPKNYLPPIDKESQIRLKNATLHHLEENYGEVMWYVFGRE